MFNSRTAEFQPVMNNQIIYIHFGLTACFQYPRQRFGTVVTGDYKSMQPAQGPKRLQTKCPKDFHQVACRLRDVTAKLVFCSTAFSLARGAAFLMLK